jgi:hypothetical protein
MGSQHLKLQISSCTAAQLHVITILCRIFCHDAGQTFRQVWSEDFNPCENDGVSCVNGLRTSVWSFEEGDGSKYGTGVIGERRAELYDVQP